MAPPEIAVRPASIVGVKTVNSHQRLGIEVLEIIQAVINLSPVADLAITTTAAINLTSGEGHVTITMATALAGVAM